MGRPATPVEEESETLPRVRPAAGAVITTVFAVREEHYSSAGT